MTGELNEYEHFMREVYFDKTFVEILNGFALSNDELVAVRIFTALSGPVRGAPERVKNVNCHRQVTVLTKRQYRCKEK